MSSEPEDERPFERVVMLNEAAKQLLARSTRVDLLALDAMVQSKRGGGNLRGFDEVSSQMRLWSRELLQQLGELSALSASVLLQTSQRSKQARKLDLLAAAASASENPTLLAAHERLRAEHDALGDGLRKQARRTQNLLSDIDQLGMMAIVLSRSAMIEAASGDDQQREQLCKVSREFHQNSESVLEIIKSTLQATRAGRSP